MARKKRKGTAKRGSADTFVADFGNMEESEGGGARYPEGDYIGTITKATRDVSSEKGTPHIKLVLKIKEPEKYKGKKITERLWSTPKSLSRIYDLLTILGIKVPKKEVAIPLKKLVGKDIGFTLVDEEYEGKKRSRVAWDWLDPDDVFTDEDDEDEEDDDLELDEEDEDEDEDEEDDLEEMDRSELKAYIKENKLDVKVKKSMDEDDIREAIEEAEEEEDEDDEEEDEDDELEELDLDEL